MPRASWRGFLRLSLVTCPVYLSPATTGTKPIRLHQVWQPAPVEVNEDALPDRSAGQRGSASSAPQLAADHTNPEAAQSRAAARIALRPHDPGTGEEIDKTATGVSLYREIRGIQTNNPVPWLRRARPVSCQHPNCSPREATMSA